MPLRNDSTIKAPVSDAALASFREQVMNRLRAMSGKNLTAADLWPLLKIQDKNDRIIPFVLNEAQRRLRDGMTGRDLVLKSRQMGLSTFIQADQYVRANTSRIRCATLAHDDSGTAFLRQMSARFWENLPEDKRGQRGRDNATTTQYLHTGSEIFIATAGSANKGRAGTYRYVHGSEVAFWKDASATIAGLMQGVPADGTIILESTPNGAQGWFYERCMAALDGDTTWTLHFFPWWLDGGYRLPLEAGETLKYEDDEARLVREHGLTPEQIKWRRFKQNELRDEFAQEYPEDPVSCFLLSGRSFFGPLEETFVAPFGAEYNAEHRYIAGLDFAQANDWTVLSIIDAATREQVALLRIHNLPWAEMRRQIIELCNQWHVHVLWAESNSIGTPNIEELIKADLPVIGFATTPRSKPGLITNYGYELNERELKLLDLPEQRREHQAFVARQSASGHWTYSAQEPEHDDIVIANALAAHGLTATGGALTIGRAPKAIADLFTTF